MIILWIDFEISRSTDVVRKDSIKDGRRKCSSESGRVGREVSHEATGRGNRGEDGETCRGNVTETITEESCIAKQMDN